MEKAPQPNRRDFLKESSMALGFLPLEKLLAKKDSTKGKGLSTKAIESGLKKYQPAVEDPNDYLKYLKEREFIISDDIFNAYATTVAKGPEWRATPIGGYLFRNYLDTPEEKSTFRKKLITLGLNKKAIFFFEDLFSSNDMIVFRESLLKDVFFEKALPHERFHKEIKKLSPKEYQLLLDTAITILNLADENNLLIVKEKIYPGKKGSGFMIMEAHLNAEEFYTYLAQGEFEDEAEKILKNDYPDVYKIYWEIKKKCKLEE